MMLRTFCIKNLFVFLVPLTVVLADVDSGIRSEVTENGTEANSNVGPTAEFGNATDENVTEMSWTEKVDREYAKKNITIGWKGGINPYTDAPDCCFGDDDVDCSQNCDISKVTCGLRCGSLLLPTQPAQGDKYTTQLTGPKNGLVWLRVAITDLRTNDQISVSYELGGIVVGTVTCASFTQTVLEKYFMSQGEVLFVTYETLAPTGVGGGGTGCSQWDKPTEKLSFRTVGTASCNVEVKGNGDFLSGEIVSPGYPDSPYPPNRDCSWTIRAPSEGYGINLNINELDLNGFFGDHLRINAGGLKAPSSDISGGYLLTWTNSESQKHMKVIPGGSVTLYFHTGRHTEPTSHKGFQIEYKQFGNGSVPEESTTMGPTLPTPSDGRSVNASIYTAGKTAEEVYNEQSAFKATLVTLANRFCTEENINLTEPISYKDVYFHAIMHCPSTWPYSDKCAEVIIQIVANTQSGDYELTDINIKKMWKIYGFDRNITASGLRPYQQDPDVIIWWMVAMISTLVIFILLLATAWCIQTRVAHANYVSQVKKIRNNAAEERNNKNEDQIFDFPSQERPPFIFIEEDEEDDENSFTNDHRDSYYDYDYFGSQGGSSYYSYNGGFGTSITGEKINQAFEPDEEEMEDVDLGGENFKFEFVSSHGTRTNQTDDLPVHQRVVHIAGVTGDKHAETVL